MRERIAAMLVKLAKAQEVKRKRERKREYSRTHLLQYSGAYALHALHALTHTPHPLYRFATTPFSGIFIIDSSNGSFIESWSKSEVLFVSPEGSTERMVVAI